MKLSFLMLVFLLFSSCSSKKQIVYIQDYEKKEANSWAKFSKLTNKIEANDILKIDVFTTIPEASIPYNKSFLNKTNQYNLDLLKLEGYLVDYNMMINFPVIGKISVDNLNEEQLEEKIKNLLIKGNHLTSPIINVRRINNKFTVLGEVRNPGTYSYTEKKLNILQALGYAGDITIDGKRKDITFIREEDGNKNVYNVELTKSDFLKSPIYNIKNNDIIIVNPTYSKVKSAGFIGSPSSVASIASLLLSITLLITNN